MNGLSLASRWGNSPIRSQVGFGECFGVALVSIQRQYQRGAFLNDPNPRMTPATNASLVAFGSAEPTLQIEVVSRRIRAVTIGKC